MAIENIHLPKFSIGNLFLSNVRANLMSPDWNVDEELVLVSKVKINSFSELRDGLIFYSLTKHHYAHIYNFEDLQYIDPIVVRKVLTEKTLYYFKRHK
jgi:hypothetical protein